MAPKTAIVGAGPGGCILARLFSQQSPPITCTIFEAERSIDFRSQGGTLDLRTDTGLAAVKEAGLWDEFIKYARYDGEALRVCDKKGTVYLKRNARKGADDGSKQLQEAPEIDRVQLRKILYESLPEGIVKWGHKLLRVDDNLSLHFDNGNVESGYDLIVGADGAWSKVRNLLSDTKPFYSGFGGYAMQIPDPEHSAPEVYDWVNRGSVFSYSDNKSLSGQQLGDGNISVSAYAKWDEDWMKTTNFNPDDIEGVKKHLLNEHLVDWSPAHKKLVENTQGKVQARNLYMLPVGFEWEHKRGVTLLGDAAHLMTPFAGIGVNTAFWDAMLLTRAITSASKHASLHPEVDLGDALDDAVKDYETEMLDHAHKGQKLTYETMNDMMVNPDAPRATIESWVLRHVKEDMPGWAHPIASAAVYTGYFVYKLFV